VTPEDGKRLLEIARRTVGQRLGAPAVEVPRVHWLSEPGAAFVTVRRGTKLHGCIGNVEPDGALGDSVARNAALAAFEDPRSRPLRSAELPEVRFEVSVLGPPSPLHVTSEADACARLRPGVDGVILSRGARRALFLPQVWRTLPDPLEFLSRLKEKAGLPPAFWDDKVRLEVFQVQSFAEPGYQEEEAHVS
jgi:hypothetical protein